MVGHRSSYGGRPGAVWIRRKRHSSDSRISTSPPVQSRTMIDASAAAAAAAIDVHHVSTTTAANNVSSGSETEADHHHPNNYTNRNNCHHDASSDGQFWSGMDSSPDSLSNGVGGVGGGGERRLIGWDDDLGRPIYELVSQGIVENANHDLNDVDVDAGTTRTTRGEHDGDHDENHDENQDEDASSASSTEEDGDSNLPLSLTQESLFDDAPPPSPSKMAVTAKDSSRARSSRSYGGRKRGRAGLSAASEAILQGSHGDNEQAAAVAAAASIPQAKKTKRDTSKKTKTNKKKDANDCAASPTDTATTADISTDTTSPSQSHAGKDSMDLRPTIAATTTAASAATVPTEFDVLTPQPYSNNRDSICNILDSDVQKSATKTAATTPIRAMAGMNNNNNKSKGLVLDLDAKDDDGDNEEQGQRPQQKNQKQENNKIARRQYGRRLQPRKTTAGTAKDSSDVSPSNAEMEPSELDFDATADNNDDKATTAAAASSKPNQPCGQTSLSAARAFFEHLDSTHQLAVDSTVQSPELRRNRRGSGAAANNIRTARSVGVDDPKLLREYEEYCKTTEVTPLPIQDYVKHRTSFFCSSTTICDGLLDENQECE